MSLYLGGLIEGKELISEIQEQDEEESLLDTVNEKKLTNSTDP